MVGDAHVGQACGTQCLQRQRAARDPDQCVHALVEAGATAAKHRDERQLSIDGDVHCRNERSCVSNPEAPAMVRELPGRNDGIDLTEPCDHAADAGRAGQWLGIGQHTIPPVAR